MIYHYLKNTKQPCIYKNIYMSLSSLVFLHLTSPMAVLDQYQLISVIVSRPTVLRKEQVSSLTLSQTCSKLKCGVLVW